VHVTADASHIALRYYTTPALRYLMGVSAQ
jgi:hypothetical protein